MCLMTMANSKMLTAHPIRTIFSEKHLFGCLEMIIIMSLLFKCLQSYGSKYVLCVGNCENIIAPDNIHLNSRYVS